MKSKKKLARKLMSRKEILSKTPIFSSKNWLDRKNSISKKITKKTK